MATPRSVEGLLALLHEQRLQVDLRSALERDSPEWQVATDRLDELNREIMYLAEYGASRREGLADGLELDLDSRPEGDLTFRQSVVDCIRRSMTLTNYTRLIQRTNDLLVRAADNVATAQELVVTAERSLQNAYPRATLTHTSGDDEGAAGVTLHLRADREGRVA
jgi:hypothetical protein